MAEKQTIEQRIIALVADELNVENDDEITLNASLVDDLGADSLDEVELCMRVEEEFGLAEMPDEEAEKIKSVGDLVRYVEQHIEDGE